jgi:hypothetical protein
MHSNSCTTLYQALHRTRSVFYWTSWSSILTALLRRFCDTPQHTLHLTLALTHTHTAPICSAVVVASTLCPIANGACTRSVTGVHGPQSSPAWPSWSIWLDGMTTSQSCDIIFESQPENHGKVFCLWQNLGMWPLKSVLYICIFSWALSINSDTMNYNMNIRNRKVYTERRGTCTPLQ